MDLALFRDVWDDLPYDDGHFAQMEKWENVYEGKADWLTVRRAGLQRGRLRRMSTLNMGKLLCDEFARKIFAEQVDISTGDVEYDEWLADFLNREGFWKHIPDLISVAFAVGGGCIKEYIGDGRVHLNYIGGDRFYPTQWDNKEIIGGVFGTTTYKNGKYYTYMERHSYGGNTAKVERRLFASDTQNNLGDEIDVSTLYDLDDMPAVDVPCFQYFKPAVMNNVDELPLGIAIYANTLDTLEALDVAFDSFAREFILGKKRIIVPAGCVRTVIDPDTGKLEKYFDTDDEVYQAMHTDDDNALKITDNTVELRVEEHVAAINALLNILCMQIGLSPGSFSFDQQQGMKTATEVISQESKTALTIKTHKNALVETLEGMCRAVFALAVQAGELPAREYKLSVGFKDSIIIDDSQMIENNINLVAAGLKSKVTAMMEIMRCDEETARAELERINAEAPPAPLM